MAADLDRVRARVDEALPEFGVMPFWFWNDDLDDRELIRQLHVFRAAGVGGVVIHPRVGLSRRIGYLTETYFRLVRRIVDECAALGMAVILYDEGGYPSGSACGQVVAANPAYAARGLVAVQQTIRGPWRGYWRPADGRSLVNRIVCAVAAPLVDGEVQPGNIRLLTPTAEGLLRLDLDAGDWRIMTCFDVPSGGTIRGVFPEHEDGTATAPPAADLMCPEAVAAFLRLTHDAYARALGEHLGKTVLALFTDEPEPLGRNPRADAYPYSPRLERQVAGTLGWTEERVLAWLPALWIDYGPDTGAFRDAYMRAVHQRVLGVFYGAQADWCERHGLALTGHPAAGNDMASLAPFRWPGQDTVWRWVQPGDDSGVVGPESVTAKAATSAARAGRRRRSVAEVFGAYGWNLSLDEVKWLVDWHFARGANLLIPHALFYSVRAGRAFESAPDIGIHNAWWPHIQEVLRYCRRLSWLLTDCEQVCDVAIVGTGHALPWAAARVLYEHQIDFLYIDDASLAQALVADGRLQVGDQSYRAVIVDAPVALSSTGAERLDAFRRDGGAIIHHRSETDLVAAVHRSVSVDVSMEPDAHGLRVMHVRKEGLDLYALFNEGDTALAGTLTVQAIGIPEWWDLWHNETYDAAIVEPLSGRATRHGDAAGTAVHLALERRESRVLVVTPGQNSTTISAVAVAERGGARDAQSMVIATPGPWRVTDMEGRAVAAPAPGDWTTRRDLELFSGTLVYETEVALPGPPDGIELDLGVVGDSAVVVVNGARMGSALWAPYRITRGREAWRAGQNLLQVQVTNTSANSYEGAMRPSGLMGPVCLRIW